MPPDVGMKKRPCRFSERVLLTVSIELELLVLPERRPRVALVAAMISSGDGIMCGSRRSDGRT